jgi:hypothetical protein
MFSKLLIIVSMLLFCSVKNFNIEQGIIAGQVGIYEGNCMPSPGVPPCKPSPISTTIFITQPSKTFHLNLLEDSVVSDANGHFNLILPIGNYSLFLRDGSIVVCDKMSCNTTCICSPFSIYTDSTTVLNPNLDHASW